MSYFPGSLIELLVVFDIGSIPSPLLLLHESGDSILAFLDTLVAAAGVGLHGRFPLDLEAGAKGLFPALIDDRLQGAD